MYILYHIYTRLPFRTFFIFFLCAAPSARTAAICHRVFIIFAEFWVWTLGQHLNGMGCIDNIQSIIQVLAVILIDEEMQSIVQSPKSTASRV